MACVCIFVKLVSLVTMTLKMTRFVDTMTTFTWVISTLKNQTCLKCTEGWSSLTSSASTHWDPSRDNTKPGWHWNISIIIHLVIFSFVTWHWNDPGRLRQSPCSPQECVVHYIQYINPLIMTIHYCCQYLINVMTSSIRMLIAFWTLTLIITLSIDTLTSSAGIMWEGGTL